MYTTGCIFLVGLMLVSTARTSARIIGPQMKRSAKLPGLTVQSEVEKALAEDADARRRD